MFRDTSSVNAAIGAQQPNLLLTATPKFPAVNVNNSHCSFSLLATVANPRYGRPMKVIVYRLSPNCKFGTLAWAAGIGSKVTCSGALISIAQLHSSFSATLDVKQPPSQLLFKMRPIASDSPDRG